MNDLMTPLFHLVVLNLASSAFSLFNDVNLVKLQHQARSGFSSYNNAGSVIVHLFWSEHSALPRPRNSTRLPKKRPSWAPYIQELNCCVSQKLLWEITRSWFTHECNLEMSDCCLIRSVGVPCNEGEMCASFRFFTHSVGWNVRGTGAAEDVLWLWKRAAC